MEAEEEGVPTREAFDAYLRGSAGGFAVAAGRLLGAPPALLPALQRAGAAYGLAGVLRSVPALAAQGRCLLPLDVLAEAGLAAQEVIAAPQARAVGSLLQELAAAARAEMTATRRALRGLPRHTLAAALPSVLARRDLARLAMGRIAAGPGRGLGDRAAVVWSGLRGRL
jgi:phytoene synthase